MIFSNQGQSITHCKGFAVKSFIQFASALFVVIILSGCGGNTPLEVTNNTPDNHPKIGKVKEVREMEGLYVVTVDLRGGGKGIPPLIAVSKNALIKGEDVDLVSYHSSTEYRMEGGWIASRVIEGSVIESTMVGDMYGVIIFGKRPDGLVEEIKAVSPVPISINDRATLKKTTTTVIDKDGKVTEFEYIATRKPEKNE